MNTIRRALDILEGLGVASSLQGKGTLVRKEPGEINMEKTEIQEGMRLFQDSMELLEATIRPISVYTLKEMCIRDREYTGQMLSQMQDEGGIYGVPTIVSAFGLYCNLDLLKEHKQEVPRNLEEWKEVCEYFKKEGITPIIANNDISLKTLAIGRGFFSCLLYTSRCV